MGSPYLSSWGTSVCEVPIYSLLGVSQSVGSLSSLLGVSQSLGSHIFPLGGLSPWGPHISPSLLVSVFEVPISSLLGGVSLLGPFADPVMIYK